MYHYASQRIDELLPLIPDDMPVDHPLMQELNIVSSIVEEYENEHFPIGKPTLGQIIADAMSEAGMTGKQLAERLGVSPSRVSDYINDRAEPTLKTCRQLCTILNIKPYEILEEHPVMVAESEAQYGRRALQMARTCKVKQRTE